MNTIIKNISAAVLAISLFTACEKERGPLTDIKPDIPVLVSNAVDYRPEPTVTVSKAAVVSPGVLGPITITLSIPQGTGRSIKEITKVAAATTYSTVQGTTGLYNLAPIPATTATTVTFTTNLTEYTAKTGQPVTATNTELGRRFYFVVTLDDNSTIVTEPVRVLVQD